MDSLKNLRISLKFSEKEEEQAEVAKFLKQLGRKKSAFITKAVKFYLENNPTPDIPGNNIVITNMLTENIVKSTILKMIQSGELTYNGNLKNISAGNIVENNSQKNITENDYIEKESPLKSQKVTKVTKKPEEKIENIPDNNDIPDSQDVEDMLEMLSVF